MPSEVNAAGKLLTFHLGGALVGPGVAEGHRPAAYLAGLRDADAFSNAVLCHVLFLGNLCDKPSSALPRRHRDGERNLDHL